MRVFEFGIRNVECGVKDSEDVAKGGRWEAMEVGIGTRRRPIGRDYAAAKDAEGGNKAQGDIGSKLKAQG